MSSDSISKEYIDLNKCYRLLLNLPPDKVKIYIEHKAENVDQAFRFLDMVLEVKAMFPNVGKEFSWTKAFYLYTLERNKNIKPYVPPMPKLMDRLKNLKKALFRFVLNGMPIVERKIAERRVAICETNVCGFYDGSICRHQRCGCFTKVKSFLLTEHCPVGKW